MPFKMRRLDIPRLEDAEWLHEQYVVKRRTMTDIGREQGCGYTVVQKRLKEFGVKRPPRSFPVVDTSFGHWLAGFIDGEGCFTLRRHGSGRYLPFFSVVLRDDDQPILDEIHQLTGVGIVRRKAAQLTGTYHVSGRLGTARGRPQYGWHAGDRMSLLRLVELLDQFPLRSKKARDYAVWREAILVWGNEGKPYKSGAGAKGREALACWDRLSELAIELKTVKAYC